MTSQPQTPRNVIVRPNLEAGRRLAGSFLPPGGLLAGTVREEDGAGPRYAARFMELAG